MGNAVTDAAAYRRILKIPSSARTMRVEDGTKPSGSALHPNLSPRKAASARIWATPLPTPPLTSGYRRFSLPRGRRALQIVQNLPAALSVQTSVHTRGGICADMGNAVTDAAAYRRISKISSFARTQCPCASNSRSCFALWNRRPLQDAACHRLRHESVSGLQRYAQTGLPTGRRGKGVCCFPRRHKCAPRPSGHSRRRVRRDQGALAGHIFVAAGAFRAEIRGIVRTIAGARIPSPDRAFKRSFRRMFLSLNISRIALARKRVRPEAQDGYSLRLLRAYGYFPSRLMQQNALEGARLFRGVFEKRNFA